MTAIAPWLWIILAVVAVIAVVYVVRRKPTARPYEERLEQDTVWNDPVGRDAAGRVEADRAIPPSDRPLP